MSLYVVHFIAVCLLLIATLLPLWRNPHWSVRGFDFPRLQLAVLGAVLALTGLWLLDFEQASSWFVLSVSLACCAYQLWWVLPYTSLWPVEVKAARDGDAHPSLSILTSNVLTPNKQAGKLLALVRAYQPDILVTLESDQWWQEALSELEQSMPHTVQCPLDNLYGMHVYSRLPLLDTQLEFLVEKNIPSVHAQVVLSNQQHVRMHFLHPAPPSPTENAESAERDAELIVVARSVADSDQPVIVTGDLNDVAWSRTTRLFRKISGLLDPRVGRGMFNTFHVSWPFLRWPLDHLFHSQHFLVADIERLPSIGSDHFPLYSRLVFVPAEGQAQEGLTAADDDHELAQDIVDEKRVSKTDVPQPGE